MLFFDASGVYTCGLLVNRSLDLQIHNITQIGFTTVSVIYMAVYPHIGLGFGHTATT